MESELTIIMSNYNQSKYIKSAIDSVLSQKTNFNWQLLITDDNSTKDNSIEIIKEYVHRYPDKIKALFNKKNGGYLENVLRAKKITKTPYFCLLDADDYWLDDFFLQRSYDFLQKHLEYVIYYENVECLLPDGTCYPFINPNIVNSSYTIEDLFADRIYITQTTGQFYRNVLFKNGIPEIIETAIGTVSEHSFEGDTDRFILHLKYGKAYFNNIMCGVYRILPNAGIWSKLTQFKKNLLAAQSYYDYFRYFEYTHADYFIHHSLFYVKECLEELKKAIDKNEFTQTIIQSDIIQLFDIIVEDEKYFKEAAADNGKTHKRNSITIKKMIKFLLPYGFVRLIQKIRKR